MHEATESRHTIVPTEHMLHSTQTLGAKRERLLEKVSTTSIADCGGHDLRTAPSPSTVTARLETEGVEDNVHGAIAEGIECTTHGGPPRQSHRAYTQKSIPFLSCVPHRERC